VSAGKINEDATQASYFSHQRRQVEVFLTMKGRQIPFVKNVKYLGVIFDERNYMEIKYRNDRRQGPTNIC
jgi:hypothetical protein